MTGQEKINKIIDAIKSGRTVYISTHTKSTKVSPKTLAAWEKSGHDLFKASDNSMYMARGRKYDCIDFCKIEVI